MLYITMAFLDVKPANAFTYLLLTGKGSFNFLMCGNVNVCVSTCHYTVCVL